MALFSGYIDKAFRFEGGFVNHPNDPGGATNRGITLETWRMWGYDKDQDGDIDVDDLRLITEGDAEAIYKQRYWDKVKGDYINSQDVAEIIVDHGINAGPSRATKMTQYLLRTRFGKTIVIDGAFGPNTLNALNSVNAAQFFNAFRDLREHYYYYRANMLQNVPQQVQPFLSSMISPSNSALAFIDGWINRVQSFDKKKVVTTGGIILIAALGWLTWHHRKDLKKMIVNK